LPRDRLDQLRSSIILGETNNQDAAAASFAVILGVVDDAVDDGASMPGQMHDQAPTSYRC
jgi:hypothetical protein